MPSYAGSTFGGTSGELGVIEVRMQVGQDGALAGGTVR